MKTVKVSLENEQNERVYCAQNFNLKVGDVVLVPTDNGIKFARVLTEPEVYETKGVNHTPENVLRVATEKDYETQKRNKAYEEEAVKVAVQKVEKHNLPMKVVRAENYFDSSKLVIYFTADTRVDFRDLVKDLASYFHTRIELRQIGIRDECKMLGGLAPCGRPCCCSSQLKDFTHVSVKMVKMQGLSLNPVKISGLCGRLMCCLQYENAHYTETAQKMPKIGSDVITPDGKGIAVSANMLKDEVRVKLSVKDGFEYRDYPLSALKLTKRMANPSTEQSNHKDEDDDILPQE